jgi:hypothetical protein
MVAKTLSPNGRRRWEVPKVRLPVVTLMCPALLRPGRACGPRAAGTRSRCRAR